MEFVVGDLLTVEGEKYITLEVLSYEGNNYAFVNKITSDEEITDEYYIFKALEDDNIKVVVEENLRNTLLEKFEELIKKDVQHILESE